MAFIEFVARSFIRLHVADPQMRDLMWAEFEAALGGAREASASRMPWEKASQVSEVSGSQAHDVLQQMLWSACGELGAIDDPDILAELAPAKLAEAEALVAAFAGVHRELSADLEAGRLSFSGGEVTGAADGTRRCKVCGTSIEDRPKGALYCEKHRNARQARYRARKHPPKNKS